MGAEELMVIKWLLYCRSQREDEQLDLGSEGVGRHGCVRDFGGTVLEGVLVGSVLSRSFKWKCSVEVQRWAWNFKKKNHLLHYLYQVSSTYSHLCEAWPREGLFLITLLSFIT